MAGSKNRVVVIHSTSKKHALTPQPNSHSGDSQTRALSPKAAQSNAACSAVRRQMTAVPSSMSTKPGVNWDRSIDCPSTVSMLSCTADRKQPLPPVQQVDASGLSARARAAGRKSGCGQSHAHKPHHQQLAHKQHRSGLRSAHKDKSIRNQRCKQQSCTYGAQDRGSLSLHPSSPLRLSRRQSIQNISHSKSGTKSITILYHRPTGRRSSNRTPSAASIMAPTTDATSVRPSPPYKIMGSGCRVQDPTADTTT